MKKVSDIFEVEYPKTLVLNQQEIDPTGVIFVSSKGTNNGISARIKENPNAKKYKSGAITVALKGTVMSAFLQLEDFYIAHQTAVLYPKVTLSDEQKLYYCQALSANKYRFNYGRQADRTLRDMRIPAVEEIPNWVYEVDSHKHDNDKSSFSKNKVPNLNTAKWKNFELQELFLIKKGKRLTKANMKEGKTPFIGAIDSNNGYRQFISHEPIHEGGTITVNYNGNGVAEAFYQPNPFWATDDVNVLYPKFELNCYIAMFFATLIKMEKYRFNYGRKWHMERMNVSEIRIPVLENGKPDLKFMENYIKTLPYSNSI